VRKASHYLLLALACALPAAAEPDGAPLIAALGVQIQKPAGDNVHFAHGSGVFLGNGLVLTAAHVVTFNAQDPNVAVFLDGWKTNAKVFATGQNGLDLALLKIDPSEISAQRRILSPVQLCTTPPDANQQVIVAAEGQVSFSAITPLTSGKGSNDLATLYEQGASGGGVFDPGKGCLIGIIILARSGQIAGQDIRMTEFVPAAKIAPFLAANLH
jgi:hypothetical protein